MAWLVLIIGGLFEVAFTFCLKMSENFTRGWWTLGFFISISMSFYLLSVAIRTIPIGTAYGVWTGIGAVGTALIGIAIFKEPSTFWRLFFIVLLIGSIVGLKVVSKQP